MFPCCELCYQKYLEEDGSIDSNTLREIREAYNKKYNRNIQPFTDDNKPCMCECHIKGLVVLH